MLDTKVHRLLLRQIKKSGLEFSQDPKLQDLLKNVNEAYKCFDKDIKHAELILEKSSQELFLANQNIRAERDNTMTKLENIVDNVNGVIFETDLNGKFTFLNNSWTDYTGIPIQEALGREYREFLPTKNNDKNQNIDNLYSAKDEEVIFIFKYKIRNKRCWFEAKTKLIRDKNNKPVGYIGTIIDVTNLKNTQIKLQKASKSKDAFLSTMSHEIRTPLNAVIGISNILLMEDYLPNQTENLKTLKYSSEHLLGLINDILDFDKIKSGQAEVVKQQFNLRVFIENIKSHFNVRAQEKDLRFNIIREQDVPDHLIGDQLKLTQVVNNLLSNSFKFTEKGGVNLLISRLEPLVGDIAKLQFKISDTGIGIPSKKQSIIFKSFVQAANDTSNIYGGTGLGLPICKKLLKLQDSNLAVYSKPGMGATFTFVIDYKIDSSPNHIQKEPIKLKEKFEPLNVKVLVAEDNKLNVLILQRFFANWNVEHSIASNGEKAIQAMIEDNFDLILMDLQMPIVDGYEATKSIRSLDNKEKANIPIYALTAFAQIDIREKTQQCKMNGFMGKPFDPEKLYKLLKAYSKS